jgi:hypothetical protein
MVLMMFSVLDDQNADGLTIKNILSHVVILAELG